MTLKTERKRLERLLYKDPPVAIIINVFISCLVGAFFGTFALRVITPVELKDLPHEKTISPSQY